MGGGGALPDHVVDDPLQVVEQLVLQEEKVEDDEVLVLSQHPLPPDPQLTWAGKATFCAPLPEGLACVPQLRGLSILPCHEGH